MITRDHLREYQQVAHDHMVEHLSTEIDPDPVANRAMYQSPTGTGKSFIELAVKHTLERGGARVALVTSRVEIAIQMAEKHGVLDGDSTITEGVIESIGMDHGLWTPKRLLNRMLAGSAPVYDCLIIDEAHHVEADTYDLLAACTGVVRAAGMTATAYRGTPKGTADLRRNWGEPILVLSIEEAIERGAWNMPAIGTLPLVDDAHIRIVNGEFDQRDAEKLYNRDLIERIAIAFERNGWWDGWLYEMPVMLTVPSRSIGHMLASGLQEQGLPCCVVDADTKREQRFHHFDDCVARRSLLLNIDVVSEGVDLPIGRWVDLSPTLSPVRWLQRFGRITRPTDHTPHYVCCNRNLLRHAYLLEGLCPPAAIKQAQESFTFDESTIKTEGLRFIDMQISNRLKPRPLPLADGTNGVMYNVATMRGNLQIQYVCLMTLHGGEPFWAYRQNAKDGTATKWGRWQRCREAPVIETGYQSETPRAISDKQKLWWHNRASQYGLDGTITPNAAQFSALPVLTDCRAIIGRNACV